MELWRRRGVCTALSGPQGRGAALLVAAVVGAAVVRSAGVYLAMLSLALAQVIWASATQWVSLTGGDNGLIGLTLVNSDGRPLLHAARRTGAALCFCAEGTGPVGDGRCVAEIGRAHV